jgi:hypothetical protein
MKWQIHLIPAAVAVAAAWYVFQTDATATPAFLYYFVAAGLIAIMFPQARQALSGVALLIQKGYDKSALGMSIAVTLLAATYLVGTGWALGRQFTLGWHDEFSYALQARLFASGYLSLPTHPHWESFDTFHVLSKPVYQSMYFAGTGLAYVPFVWLGLPAWVLGWIGVSLSAGLAFWLTARHLGSTAGLMVVGLFLSNPAVRGLSILLLSSTVMIPLAMAGVVMFVLWREQMKDRQQRWKIVIASVLMGVCGGWSLITRPMDTVAVFGVLGVMVLVTMIGKPVRLTLLTIAAGVAGVLPFVAFQLLLNHNNTGSWLTTPYVLYHQQHYPELLFQSGVVDTTFDRPTIPPQKLSFWTMFVEPSVVSFSESTYSGRLNRQINQTALRGVWMQWLVVPFVIGIFYIRHSGFLAMALAVLAMQLLYATYALIEDRYFIVIAAGAAMIAVLAREWARMLPNDAVRSYFRQAIGLMILLACAFGHGQFNEYLYNFNGDTFVARGVVRSRGFALDSAKPPAIVLVKFGEKSTPHVEPVYNIDAARIDDNPIIFAHDLDPARNRKLLEYYLNQQPARRVYRMTRYLEAAELLEKPTIEELGTIQEALDRPEFQVR